MDKLSLYDILSFLVPGLITCLLLRSASPAFPSSHASDPLLTTDFEKALFGLTISLFAGLIVHAITLGLVKYNRYKKVLVPEVGVVCRKNEMITSIEPHLDTLCIAATGSPFYTAPQKVAPYFFDHAYYYLEANDKITVAKSFQSLYFFIRNTFTIALLAVPAFLLLQLRYYTLYSMCNPDYWFIVISAALGILLLPSVARTYRSKMIERVFWTYYILKTTPNNPATSVHP